MYKGSRPSIPSLEEITQVKRILMSVEIDKFGIKNNKTNQQRNKHLQCLHHSCFFPANK